MHTKNRENTREAKVLKREAIAISHASFSSVLAFLWIHSTGFSEVIYLSLNVPVFKHSARTDALEFVGRMQISCSYFIDYKTGDDE